MNGKKNKRLVRIPSAIPIYAAAGMFLLWGLFSPIYKGLFILLAAAASLGTYFLVKHFVPGRCELVEDEILTGDMDIDKQLAEGRDTIRRFREAAQVMGDASVKQALSRIADAGDAIVAQTAQDPDERTGVFTFFSYYLPTVEKLLSHYITFAGAGEGENVREGRSRIENSLGMIADAFEKQLDKMYKNEAMDIKTDIAVMEAMLKSEGLTKTETEKRADAFAEDAQNFENAVQTSSGKGGNHV